MALFEVVRPFNAMGRDLAIGERVDDRGWPSRRSQILTETRYLKPILGQSENVEPVDFTQRKRGR